MINVLILIFLVAVIVVLQSYLAKKKNKWLGLILPFLTFSISLMALLGVATSYQIGTVAIESQTVTEGGVITNQISEQPIQIDNSEKMQSISIAVYIFVLYNIPTIILLLIYKDGRKKLRKEIELEKMSIQDLE